MTYTNTTKKSSGGSGKPVIIVESPGKCASIAKYTDYKYEVIATIGHIKNLPERELGFSESPDGKIDFRTMKFEAQPDRVNTISKIKKITAGRDVFIATDADREGEAIAYDVYNEIRRTAGRIKRVKFMEITPKGVQNGLASPSDICMPTVDAQRARRLIDRIVGYKLTSVAANALGTKSWGEATVGRTQSAGVRIIYDREEAIKNFVPEPFWKILYKDEKGVVFSSKGFKDQNEAEKLLAQLKKENAVVSGVKKAVKIENPPSPLEAGTLQAAAAAKLHFPIKRTMQLAQELYQKGHITYMRSDTVRLAPETIDAARKFLDENFKGLTPPKPPTHKNAGKAQDAHEAIHPTSIDLDGTPQNLSQKADLSPDHIALYTLIYNYFYASQCKPALWDTAEVTITARTGKEPLTAKSRSLKEKGWRTFFPTEEKVRTKDKQQDNEEIISTDLNYNVKQLLSGTAESKQDFTKPPERFTESSFVKALKQYGIGRPSTYVAIWETITNRRYVELDAKKKICLTPKGDSYMELMKFLCPEITDIKFTKTMEDQLDGIEDGKISKEEVANTLNGVVIESRRRGEKVPQGKFHREGVDYSNVPYQGKSTYQPKKQSGYSKKPASKNNYSKDGHSMSR